MSIPVYQPTLNENVFNYVKDCLDSTWISSHGKYISKFEDEFAKYINIEHATSVCNGTAALHLALSVLNLKEGDEIIVPTLTYIASVNAISYIGAKPVFVDSDILSWNIDVSLIESAITPKTKAIMAVHLYGNPCNMDEIIRICKKYNIFLIEDAAEAIGGKYKEQYVGSFGDISVFSFFGNKTITTGEGGMLVTRSKEYLNRAFYLKNQAVSGDREYWHNEIGFNYRMTNVCAAIGLAQIEQVEMILLKKIEIAQWYKDLLHDLPVVFQKVENKATHSYWMVSILLENSNVRNELRVVLKGKNIETRPLFYPAHVMPVHKSSKRFPNSEYLSERGVNLPSYPDLDYKSVKYICSSIREYFSGN